MSTGESQETSSSAGHTLSATFDPTMADEMSTSAANVQLMHFCSHFTCHTYAPIHTHTHTLHHMKDGSNRNGIEQHDSNSPHKHSEAFLIQS